MRMACDHAPCPIECQSLLDLDPVEVRGPAENGFEDRIEFGMTCNTGTALYKRIRGAFENIDVPSGS